jgi:DNA invertase Pin-like site-specific DNA recombinase
MLIGYARTSTLDQTAGLDAQQRDLAAAGCERTYVEQVSSVDVGERQELSRALDNLRSGDALVVTKLDRLARSMAHLMDLLKAIDGKGASLRILSMNLDTGTPTGRLMLNVLGSVAQFEREIMLERQREGIAKAKAAGKYKGRAPSAKAKEGQVAEMSAQGTSLSEIARRLGIGKASVHRILKARRPNGAATVADAQVQ